MGKETPKGSVSKSKLSLKMTLSPSASLFNFPGSVLTPPSITETQRVRSRGSPASLRGTPSKTWDSRKNPFPLTRSPSKASLKLSTPKLTPRSKVEARKRKDSFKNSVGRKKPLSSTGRNIRSELETETSKNEPEKVSPNADTYVMRWNALQWDETYRGVHDSNIESWALGNNVGQLIRRFSPGASAPPKHNRMKLVTGTVLEGSVWLRVSDEKKKARFSYPERSTVIQACDGFSVPYGKHYSIEAGSDGAIISFNNVFDQP